MKITPDHLVRGAFIYIRQSTIDQLANNRESRLRQYGLADRARALGWTDVTVIDDDLGRSGSGVSRPGFEKLLAAICEGRVGAVVSVEASRLARNGRVRQRAHEALKQKARRGELFTTVAVGYVRSEPDRIEKDPDLRVRDGLALVFRKFAELQSVRQVHV